MPRTAKTYTVQDATGTAAKLYAWITAGIENRPSLMAFTSRLKRGERNADELRRPPNRFSVEATAKREAGIKRYHEKMKKQEAVKKPVISTPPPDIDREHQIKPSRKHQFFRHGSLDAWPNLKLAIEGKL